MVAALQSQRAAWAGQTDQQRRRAVWRQVVQALDDDLAVLRVLRRGSDSWARTKTKSSARNSQQMRRYVIDAS